jgi:hypothetical protein
MLEEVIINEIYLVRIVFFILPGNFLKECYSKFSGIYSVSLDIKSTFRIMKEINTY